MLLRLRDPEFSRSAAEEPVWLRLCLGAKILILACALQLVRALAGIPPSRPCLPRPAAANAHENPIVVGASGCLLFASHALKLLLALLHIHEASVILIALRPVRFAHHFRLELGALFNCAFAR